MSFADALVATAVTRPELGLEALHPIAYERVGDGSHTKTQQELLRDYCELTPAYEQLAWGYIGQLFDAMQSMAPGKNRDRHKALHGSSQTGIAVMTRFLSDLPYVYSAHRSKFRGKPTSIEEQTAELGSIAARSSGFITTIAAECMAVSGSIEETQDLRGELAGGRHGAGWNFVLDGPSDGLYVRSRFDVGRQIEAVNRRFARAVERAEEPAQRAVGCLALHVATDEGLTVFERLWQGMVERAATEPQLFQADLRQIDRFLNGPDC